MQQELTIKIASKKIALFSLPLIGFRLASTIVSFIGMLFIASLGHRQLAASALITPIQITLNVTGWSIIFAVAIVVGHIFGAGKKTELGKVLRQGWLIAIILSVPFMVLFWHVGNLLRLLGQEPTLIALVEPYFHVLTFGVLPGMFYMNFIQFVTGVGKQKVIIFFSLFNMIALVAVGYPLLFGKFGFPKLGMIGMAYASITYIWLASTISMVYLWKNRHFKQYEIFKFSFLDFHYLKQILHLGIPMSVQFVTELLAFSFSAIMVGWINQSSLAAAQIINQVNMIMIMGPFGISQAVSVLIGQSRGRTDYSACKKYGEAALLVGLVYTLFVAIIYWLFPKGFISLYSVDVHNPANSLTVHIAILLFAIGAFSQILDGTRNIITGALRGLKDSAGPMWLGAIAAWVIAIPSGYLFGIKLHGGAPAISVCFLVAWFITIPLLVRRFYLKVRIY